MKKQILLLAIACSIHYGYSIPYTTTGKADTNPIPNAPQQKSYKAPQLIGTFYLLEIENSGKSKLETLSEGKTLTLKEDQQYTSDLYAKNEKGTWSFDETTQILTLQTEDSTSNWKLEKVNDFGMVLINTKTKETWKFSA